MAARQPRVLYQVRSIPLCPYQRALASLGSYLSWRLARERVKMNDDKLGRESSGIEQNSHRTNSFKISRGLDALGPETSSRPGKTPTDLSLELEMTVRSVFSQVDQGILNNITVSCSSVRCLWTKFSAANPKSEKLRRYGDLFFFTV